MMGRVSLGAVLLLGAVGCGDSVPLTARGGLTITNFSLDNDCGRGRPSGGLGIPGPTETDPGTGETDGQDGVTVACEVSGNDNNTVLFEGSLGKDGLTLKINGQLDDYDAASETGTGNAELFFYSFQTQGLSTLGPACDVRAVQAAPGRLWATFDCSSGLGDRDEPNLSCSMGGVVTFENCGR